MPINKYYIAIDFDGTLVTHKYPAIGEIKHDVINKLDKKYKELINIGFLPVIILWTCREGKELEDAKKWCKVNLPKYLVPIYYNENPELLPETGIRRKIEANEYWDDRAIQIN